MASDFWALDVGAGEAFLLCTEQRGRTWTILVDSGQRKGKGRWHPLVAAICRVRPSLQRIDIAICTHEDADHSNGFQTFADVWCTGGRSIGCYWLPGRWAHAFPGLLTDPFAVVQALAEGALLAREDLSADPDGQEADVRDQPAFRLSEKRIRSIAPLEELTGTLVPYETGPSDGSPDGATAADHDVATSLGLDETQLLAVEADMEESPPWLGEAILSVARGSPWIGMYEIFASSGAQKDALFASLFHRVLRTARAIQRIAVSALRHRIPVRWFDFGRFEKGSGPSGGIVDLIRPLNAVQIAAPPLRPPSSKALFFALTLSRQNVESLVFQRVETEDEPGVIFCADSRLAFGIGAPGKPFQLPNPAPARRSLVTAPHHGSRVNDYAYGVLQKWLSEELLVIRNGGMHKQSLGEYRNCSERRCVACPQCPAPFGRQVVHVGSTSPDWKWPPIASRDCPRLSKCGVSAPGGG